MRRERFGGCLLATALAGLATLGAERKPEKENVTMALRVLQLRNPDVAWRTAALRAELTDDQLPDLAVLGTNARTLIVAVIVGPVDGGSTMSSLWWQVGGDGLDVGCGRDASLSLEELDYPVDRDAGRLTEALAARARGVKGLRLVAPPCDLFHIYWDRNSRSLSWWR